MRALLVIAFCSCSPALTPAPAPTPAPALTRAPARCDSPEHRRLDFWLGEWDVASRTGERDGANAITATLGGCAIEERWEDAAGWRGQSLFFFDRSAGAWRQLWITSTGTWAEKREVAGPPGSLRFEGTVARAGGGFARSRTTLTPTGGGVSQVIEQSIDDGATWEKWEGLYTKKKPAPACATAEHRRLDFWIGEWDVVVRAKPTPTSSEWVEARGTNVVRATHAGCVVEEAFRADGPGGPWAGHSVSTLANGTWRQTWVDDSGSYLAFVGEWRDGQMFFTGEPQTKNGARVQMRMAFSEITPAAFKWRWERTTDDGATWTPVMTIDYRRRGG